MQAKAVGEYFAKYPIAAIFASPLKRALTTAQQIEKQNQSKPPLTITPLIREQHFGEAEGNPWAPAITPDPKGTKGPNDPNATGRLGVIDPKTNKKVYPVQPGRSAKFPAGESQDDVAERTGEAFDEFVMPFVRDSVGKPVGEVNVFFVSHGIAISEGIGAIFSRAVNGRGVDPDTWRGLHNTAWSRVVIGMEGEKLEYNGEELHIEVGGSHDEDEGEKLANAVESANPPTPEVEKREPRKKEIVAKVVAVNQYSHLDGVVREKGGIGSMAHDDTQKAITDFFGGGGKSKDNKEKDAMDVDTSNSSNL
ncbi:hypothetical protein FRC05_009731 [Tulasnella sp. 425]|nr:hypothetical protein FRC05_009731 [Tulasnella sp. 425]